MNNLSTGSLLLVESTISLKQPTICHISPNVNLNTTSLFYISIGQKKKKNQHRHRDPTYIHTRALHF